MNGDPGRMAGKRCAVQVGIVGMVAVTLLPTLVMPVHAFEVDVGNPDVTVRWDNTVRYNVGVRMQRPSPEIALAGPGPAYTY
jgi:hypothetical protein